MSALHGLELCGHLETQIERTIELHPVVTEEGGEKAPWGRGFHCFLKGKSPGGLPIQEGKNTTSFTLNQEPYLVLCFSLPFGQTLVVNLYPAAKLIFLKYSFDQATPSL